MVSIFLNPVNLTKLPFDFTMKLLNHEQIFSRSEIDFWERFLLSSIWYNPNVSTIYLDERFAYYNNFFCPKYFLFFFMIGKFQKNSKKKSKKIFEKSSKDFLTLEKVSRYGIKTGHIRSKSALGRENGVFSNSELYEKKFSSFSPLKLSRKLRKKWEYFIFLHFSEGNVTFLQN